MEWVTTNSPQPLSSFKNRLKHQKLEEHISQRPVISVKDKIDMVQAKNFFESVLMSDKKTFKNFKVKETQYYHRDHRKAFTY